MGRIGRFILDRLPYIGGLRKQVRKQGAFPAGHYHSPIPSQEEVLTHLSLRQKADSGVPDVQVDKDGHFELLQKFQKFYGELPFPIQRTPDCRYYYENPSYSYGDAIFLYSFLRNTLPRKIIEVGSGFSSAVILETAERFFPHRAEIVFIEPYPERLKALLNPQDEEKARIIERRVQEVPLDIFGGLKSGDFLFIDSSHVIKAGSDVHFLMFDVLPRLPAGVFVHFHDMFYPFEYPAEWLLSGNYWNEDYFLRAFLAGNERWRIHFFNTYAAAVFKDFLAARMPLCLRNIGGSLYLRREK